uniref:Uncharacterized protein n=1 Tax=Opuntia streptacantha TaxID=393608 RepID=A0A7C8Z070_OPUST
MLCPLDAFEINPLLIHFIQRAHIPQLFNLVHCQFNRPINLLLCSEPPNPKPNRGVSHFLIHSKSPEHIGWLQACTSTSTPTRNCHFLQTHQQALPFNKPKQKVQIPRVPPLHTTINLHSINPLPYPFRQPLLQSSNPPVIILHLLHSQLTSSPETNNQWRGYSPPSNPSFLTNSFEARPEFGAVFLYTKLQPLLARKSYDH